MMRDFSFKQKSFFGNLITCNEALIKLLAEVQ